MKVTITGRKANLRENFKELTKKKLSRFDRIFDENATAKVVVTVERNRQTVEITIENDGMFFRSEATDFEMNTALDQVISSLGRQIRKNKSKLDRQIHSTALDQYVQKYVNAKEEPEEDYKVERRKHFIVKPMSVNEAILQMNMLEHQFFMFRNEETEEINVVYRRKEGNYGLLEPEESDD
ncbi:MAG TPA: ribosome-associated translation inhibitor RaiA [Ruminococcaceae bacterium]|nr:ribosome-associated translation inhibitor RaiA [Oscillospiraceae bacterium]HCC02308.1 ribosome-associated translation inhibitor RaiA [Oscillospiraceae bacterium]HCM23541.1 ribosome-associated translation inhibitor RaiA [Oscillospiraceae bacterium]